MKDLSGRKYQITINNPEKYKLTASLIKEKLEELTLTYYCYAFEIGEQGTEHVHIFLYSESPVRFSTLKNKFNSAHIERAYGSISDNRDYILKSGKWLETTKANTSIEGSFYESSSPPEEKSSRQSMMALMLEDLHSGFTVNEIICKYPSLALKINDLYQLQEQIMTSDYQVNTRDVKVYYFYGSTGTGKTSSVFNENKNASVCRITSYDNSRALFDNYRAHNVIVLEEFHSQIPLPELLSYLDKYPINLPARYHTKTACYTKVYILSNIDITQQYEHERKNDPKTWDAFIRRIYEIRHYHQDFSYTIEEKPKPKGEENIWEEAIPFSML